MICYKSGYKYQLAADYKIKLTQLMSFEIAADYLLLKDGTLTIFKGYAWDGASGPAIDTKNFMRGSLVHDVLYQLMREGHLPRGVKAYANETWRIICIEDGMSKIRAWWVHEAVKRFGKYGTIKNKDIKVAP